MKDKQQQIVAKLLHDLNITEPLSFAQQMSIERLADMWIDYGQAKANVSRAKREVDQQHWRKMKVALSKEVDRLTVRLGLDKVKVVSKRVSDHFPVKKKGLKIVQDRSKVARLMGAK